MERGFINNDGKQVGGSSSTVLRGSRTTSGEGLGLGTEKKLEDGTVHARAQESKESGADPGAGDGDDGSDEGIRGIRLRTMEQRSWEGGGRTLEEQEEEEEEEDGERMRMEEESALPLMNDGLHTGRAESLETGPSGGTYTVEDAINFMGFGRFQMGMVGYAGVMWLADAGEMTLLSFIGASALCEWHLSSVEEESLSSAVFVGVLFGAYLWGILSDLSGRRVAFMAIAIFTTVFALLSAWSPTYWFLIASRTLVGVGLGGGSVAFSLCMEFLPEKGRGFWLVFIEVFWSVGSISEALLAWFILPSYNWRWLVAASAVPFIVLLGFYPTLPESPRYLMMRGDSEGAMNVLRRIAKVNGKALPHGILTLSHQSEDSEFPSTLKEKSKSGLTVGGGVKLGSGGFPVAKQLGRATDKLRLLFSPDLQRTTLLLWFLFFANAFIYYGLVLLTTELQLNKGSGRDCTVPSPTSLYATRCLPNGFPLMDSSQFKSVLITCIAELPGLLVAALVVDRLGRKISIGALLIACGISLAPLVTPLGQVATTFLMFVSRSCITGAFSVLWAYAPELYYTSVRTTGVGSANSSGRIGGFLCPFVAIGLIESCNRTLAVGLFSAASVLAGVSMFFFPKEIKSVDEHPRRIPSG